MHCRRPGDLRRAQHRLAGFWAWYADGCRCDRPTADTIAGVLEVESLERAKWRGMPAIVGPLVMGSAVA